MIPKILFDCWMNIPLLFKNSSRRGWKYGWRLSVMVCLILSTIGLDMSLLHPGVKFMPIFWQFVVITLSMWQCTGSRETRKHRQRFFSHGQKRPIATQLKWNRILMNSVLTKKTVHVQNDSLM